MSKAIIFRLLVVDNILSQTISRDTENSNDYFPELYNYVVASYM